MKIDKIDDSKIETISQIIASILTGSSITSMFNSLGDIRENEFEQKGTKWRRIQSACNIWQSKYNCSNKIIEMIEYVMRPSKYVHDLQAFEINRGNLNLQLSFIGLFIDKKGTVIPTPKATTIQESREKIDFLLSKLQDRNVHPKIVQICKPDIINEDYFSLIFESSKCIYDKIRELTGLNKDGNQLIHFCFDDSLPIIIFNKMITQSEKDEYTGFRQLLFSIGNMFRNPKAHELKFFSYTNLDECLDIICLISFALKKLDTCSLNTHALYTKTQ